MNGKRVSCLNPNNKNRSSSIPERTLQKVKKRGPSSEETKKDKTYPDWKQGEEKHSGFRISDENNENI